MPLPFLSHQQSLRCLMLLAHGAQAIEERGWLQAVGVVRIGVGQADGAILGDDEGAGYGEFPGLVTVESREVRAQALEEGAGLLLKRVDQAKLTSDLVALVAQDREGQL